MNLISIIILLKILYNDSIVWVPISYYKSHDVFENVITIIENIFAISSSPNYYQSSQGFMTKFFSMTTNDYNFC